MHNLKSIILIPLKIKRKGLVPPILLMLFFLLAMIVVPGIVSLFVEDENTFIFILLLSWLVLLPLFLISVAIVIMMAVNKKFSVFRYIPEAPEEATFKMNVLFDFVSSPGQMLYQDGEPEALRKSGPMVTIYEADKAGRDFEGMHKVSELMVNHKYRLAMFLRLAAGIGPGGRYGFTGTMQAYWYLFIGEEYDALMQAMQEHRVDVKITKQNDIEAKYIVDGIMARS
ncbi:MAG: hypothetical protein E7285_00200 [Lachnospiraceae bacterium]|nr:hypothetical protein [Lachnospiraceae bacterium]